MDFIELCKGMPRDRDLPERAFRIEALTRVLDNAHYDHIEHPFSREYVGMNEYNPLDRRRPSVKSNLCRVVVDDSVSMLFSDDKFPRVQGKTPEATAAFGKLVKALKLPERMFDAATRGSVGSVAIWFRVIDNRPLLTVLPTTYLAPEWDAFGEELVRVTEKYKVPAADLIAQGYKVKADDGPHWFQRKWDGTHETWFHPWPVKDDKAKPRVDKERTVKHNLGFCPLVWVKNLPGGDDVDGPCTFEAAIDTVIEIDFLYSQTGRALRYSADPKLIIRTDEELPKIVGGAANALEISANSDAKLLELDGTGISTMLDVLRELRNVALEAVHGLRAHSDKLTMPNSGKAMEMLHQPVVWLAGKLRHTYGEGAILDLMRMACAAAERVPGGLLHDGEEIVGLSPEGLSLNWPMWFSPTAHDFLETAQALAQLRKEGLTSRETAIKQLSPVLDVEDVQTELAAIDGDAPPPSANAAEAEKADLPA